MGVSPAPEAPRSVWGDRWVRIVSVVTLVWTYVTIVVGADVTATDSQLACVSWPTCTGQSLLPTSYAGGVLIEFTHRVAALVLSLLILALLVLILRYEGHRRSVRRLGVFAFGLLIFQAALGAVIIFTQAAAVVVILHLAVATLLFAVLLVVALLVNLPHLPPRWRMSLFGEEDARGSPGP